MLFNDFVSNLVVCVVLEVLLGFLVPEGKMKNITLSMVGVCVFYVLVLPILNFLMVV